MTTTGDDYLEPVVAIPNDPAPIGEPKTHGGPEGDRPAKVIAADQGSTSPRGNRHREDADAVVISTRYEDPVRMVGVRFSECIKLLISTSHSTHDTGERPA